jgi:hypothetical protein
VNLLPFCQQVILLFHHSLNGVTDITALHSGKSHNRWPAVGTNNVDFGLTVAEHMDMRWFMVIDEDHKA